MEHRLSAVGVRVHHHAIPTTRDPDLARQVARETEQLPEQRRVLRVVERGHMMRGDHEEMRGRLRVQVLERQHAVAAFHDRRRDLAGGDFAEDTRSGHRPLSPRACARGQLASECLTQLLPELLAGVPFRGRLALDLGELLEQGALLRGQLDGRPDMYAHVEIAATAFPDARQPLATQRSEEHTSELQSHSDLVCRLLLEKKKNSDKYSDKHTKATASDPPET